MFFSRYGLLGASGCGKTTLLSCIVGQKSLQKGSINVLGVKVDQNTGILGPRIGYMPQVYYIFFLNNSINKTMYDNNFYCLFICIYINLGTCLSR